MQPQCAQAVQAAAKALGRKALSSSQIKAIDDRITSSLRQLARTDAEWQSLSRDQRIMAASQQAMADMQAEATRRVENTQRQIVKTAATEERIQAAMHQFESGRSEALVHDIELTGDYITGIKHEAVSHLVNLVDAVRSGEGAGPGRRAMMFLFDADNPQMTRDLATEIFRNGDGSTGNKVATDGAKAYLKVIESQRQRFNAAGGDVGRLEYGYLPQPHDASKVRGAGVSDWLKQQNAVGAAVNAIRLKEPPPAFSKNAWVSKILPLLDRSQYVLEDGRRMGDAEMRGMLEQAWETIGTEGRNKTEPGSFTGSGTKANAGSEHRQIHFKDADRYMAYMQEFGTGSMYDAVLGHIGKMSRDIGLVERYGPNPNAQFKLQNDLADRADGGVRRSMGMLPESYWDQMSGVAGAAQSARIAQIGTDLRNIQTFGKLGGAVISSITDMGTFMVTTGFNRLPYWDAIKNIGKTAASADARDFLTTHGIIAESMAGDMNRWTGDNIRQNWSGRLANSTMKLSLMNAWTDTLRRAFSLTMMQGMARMSKTEWGALSEWDRTHMERKGLTEADWQVIRKAELTEFSGKEHLTPEAIRSSLQGSTAEAPPPAAGMVRMYHGGTKGSLSKGDRRWVSQDRNYAQGYADKAAGGGEVYYVDLPQNSPLLVKAFDDTGTSVKAPYNHFEADAALTSQMKPVLSAQKATPEQAARANEVVAKVLGLIQDESEFAVLNPDLATKTLASGAATQRGRVRGELARSVMQFKSFPVAMVSRHWRRMLDAPKVGDGSAPALGNRVMYAGAMLASTTVLGAIALQAKQVIAGKDPIDPTGEHAAKFWGKAVAQGGGLSIVGDMLLNDPSETPGGFVGAVGGTVLGPTAGSALKLGGTVVENAYRAGKSKDTHLAAQSLNIAKGHLPLVGIWYGRAALDHAGLHALQENLSPGYLSKMKQRANKDFGQDYFWKPGTGLPDRGPDLAKAVGQ